MKLKSAFSPGELFIITGICVGAALVIALWAPGLFLTTASWLWLPFLFIAVVIALQYGAKTFPKPPESIISSKWLVLIKTILAFFVLVICYFALGQGLVLYQFVYYDPMGQPLFTDIHAGDQLIWTLHLTLLTWVVATALTLSMAAFDKMKISEFVQRFLPRSSDAIIIDTIIIFAMTISFMMFIALGSFEFSRSMMAYAGFERPVFPELSTLLSAVILLVGYFLLRLKNRYEQLVKKNVSIGRVLLSQTGMLVLLLLVAQLFIVFFPSDFMLSLLKPIRNIFPEWMFMDTWMSVTVSYAIVCAPLLARYFARLFTTLRIDVVAILLLLPLLISFLLPMPEAIQANLVPLTIENVVYRNHLSQVILWVALGIFFCCFIFSKSLALAWVDLMPMPLGKRLRRLRPMLAQTWLLFGLAIFYMWFAGNGYDVLSHVFGILTTLTLLWVSISLLYSLFLRKR